MLVLIFHELDDLNVPKSNVTVYMYIDVFNFPSFQI